ncbi:MAG: hypothetical protein H0T54_07840 [Geodermatophilaceae bacterium]|nr:hypothetical protein [Geodermatophilaceae bacterium]
MTPEEGVAALSLLDGSVLWKFSAIPAVPADSDRVEETLDTALSLVATSAEVSTGSQRWSLADGYAQSEFQVSTDEVALVGSSQARAGVSGHLVDVADGTTIADLDPKFVVSGCVSDEYQLIACLSRDGPDRNCSATRLATLSRRHYRRMFRGPV